MLKIKSLSKDQRAFIPEFGGERKDHHAGINPKPLTFHLLPMTEGDSEKYEESGFRMNTETGETRLHVDRDEITEIFQKYVKRIDNLTIDDQEITTAQEFLDARDKIPAGFKPLINEVVGAIRNISVLDKGAPKN